MQTTEKNLKEKNPSLELNQGAKIPALVSEGKSPSLEETSTSKSLSKDLAIELMLLIKKVNENGVSPETVNASCNAASQIHKIIRLNLDMKREGF